MAENGDSPAMVASPETPAQPGSGDGDSATSPKTPVTPDGAGAGTKSAVFRQQFRAFSKFGDPKSDGKHITLSQSDKWMKQAKVIGKVITTTDTGIYFKKLKAQKVNMDDYNKFLEDLARNKKTDIADIKNKLSICGAPGLTGVHVPKKSTTNNNGPSPNTAETSTKAQSTVERLTDVTRYTGAHKQRFDETGKGKGIAGRKDVPDASGYVHGYQNKDTYSKSH